MSILSDILGSITGEEKTESVVHPCQNCESDCSVCPDACEACKPYKEKLINALYNVANIDAFYDKYEVVTPDMPTGGTTICPACSAPVSGAVCAYCGTRVAESNGKIQVSSASEIPNPIIEARDIIYARRALVEKYAGSSESELSGILASVMSMLTGSSKDSDTETSLGNVMTESEIKAMAGRYDVSVRDYLEGLDNGMYLSKSGYEARENSTTSSSSGTGIAAGLSGGIGMAAGVVLGNQIGSNNNRPPVIPQNQQQNRPPVIPQNQQQNRPPVMPQNQQQNRPPVMPQNQQQNRPPVMPQNQQQNRPPVMPQNQQQNRPPVGQQKRPAAGQQNHVPVSQQNRPAAGQ